MARQDTQPSQAPWRPTGDEPGRFGRSLGPIEDPALALSTPEPEPTLAMHPRKFSLWLFIVSIVMIFASLTSAYVVRKGEGNWTQFELPPILWTSTAVLVASSVTVQLAWFYARRDSLNLVRLFMGLTMGLALAFMALQWEAWVRLVQINVYFVGNPSGSFLYVLTGLHAMHLVTGVVYLAIVTINTFRGLVHSGNTLDIELSATYWHFLDILWLALFGFLLVNHAAG